MKFAFVFPGQGSQAVGMLDELGESEPVASAFAAASDVLGYDLWELIQQGPAERLDVTECTQPAILTAGVAMWRSWLDAGGPRPQVMAGHSLGEFTAMVCAGALEFETAVGLVQFRGRVMQEAVPAGTGAMAALLGLDDAAVATACKRCSGDGLVVEPVNFNAPGQVVIAGHREAVERAIEVAHELGARRAILLHVSVPSHSSLMMPAAERLRERLADVELEEPQIPVVFTVGLSKNTQPDAMREALVQQLHTPVRWTETIRTMIADEISQVIECGPGKVLSGLNRRIDRSVATCGIFDRETLQKALAGVERDE